MISANAVAVEKRIAGKIKLYLRDFSAIKRRSNLFGSLDLERNRLKTDYAGQCLNVFHLQHGAKPLWSALLCKPAGSHNGIVMKWEPDGLRLSKFSDRTCFCRPFSDVGGRRPLAHVQPLR